MCKPVKPGDSRLLSPSSVFSTLYDGASRYRDIFAQFIEMEKKERQNENWE